MMLLGVFRHSLGASVIHFRGLHMAPIHFILLLVFVYSSNVIALDVTAMSFNLRVPVDTAPNDWASRKARIEIIIKKQKADFLGVQEAVPLFIADLSKDIKHYSYVGRGRDIGGLGEGTQIFFDNRRWVVDETDQGTLQFSSTPLEVGSNDWGMQWPRIFTWARMIEKKSGKAVYVFNTHFPLKELERSSSVKLLIETIAKRKNQFDPVILMGDFNACDNEASMKYIVGENGAGFAMRDTYKALFPNDTQTTFNGFGTNKSECRIDYIYTYLAKKIINAKIIMDMPQGGYASDHFPVSAKLVF